MSLIHGKRISLLALAAVVLATGGLIFRPGLKPHPAAPALLAGKRSDRSPAPVPSEAVGEGVTLILDPEKFVRMDDGWVLQEIQKRQLGRLDWRMEELATRLPLSAEQSDRLKSWRDQVAENLATHTHMADLQEAGRLAVQYSLEAFLATLLDEPQAVAFEKFRRQEYQDQVDSIRSSSLERMTGRFEIREEQREGIVRALADEVATLAAFRDRDPRHLEFFHDNFDKDPQALGIEKLIWELVGDEPYRLLSDIPRRHEFRKELRSRIDARLAALGPVLDGDQLAKYRDYLEKNWASPWLQLSLSPLDPPP